MIQKLHEEEQTQPEITYDLQLDDDEMKKKMIEDLIETGQYKEALQYLNDMDNEQVRYQRLVCLYGLKELQQAKREGMKAKSSCWRNLL